MTDATGVSIASPAEMASATAASAAAAAMVDAASAFDFVSAATAATAAAAAATTAALGSGVTPPSDEMTTGGFSLRMGTRISPFGVKIASSGAIKMAAADDLGFDAVGDPPEPDAAAELVFGDVEAEVA